MLRELFILDDRFPEAMCRLAETVGVQIAPERLMAILRDAEADQVSAKHYELASQGRVRIIGTVDEYEPESIWIILEGNRKQERAASALIQEWRLILSPNSPICLKW